MKDEKNETAINWIVYQNGELFRVNGTASEMKQILADMARLNVKEEGDDSWKYGTASASEVVVNETRDELTAYNYYEDEDNLKSWDASFVAVPEEDPIPAKTLLDNIYTGADMGGIPEELHDKICNALIEYDPEDANRGDVLYDLLKAVVKYA